MGDLLRAVRVLGPVFRLMGRYRAATVVSLVLAVGWFVVGFGGRSDAAGGPHPVGTDLVGVGGALGQSVYWLGAVSLAVSLAVFAGVGADWLYRRLSVRDGAQRGSVGRAHGRRWNRSDVPGLHDDHSLGDQVIP